MKAGLPKDMIPTQRIALTKNASSGSSSGF